MIKLRWSKGCEPKYQTRNSAAVDLHAREGCVIKAGAKAKVPTGVWIEQVLWESVPAQRIPELQIRARSGLAYKHGITLTNGVGTVDADYPDEICVLLWNSGPEEFVIKEGDRIAQMVLNVVQRIPFIDVNDANHNGLRLGGFGSTSVSSC